MSPLTVLKLIIRPLRLYVLVDEFLESPDAIKYFCQLSEIHWIRFLSRCLELRNFICSMLPEPSSLAQAFIEFSKVIIPILRRLKRAMQELSSRLENFLQQVREYFMSLDFTDSPLPWIAQFIQDLFS